MAEEDREKKDTSAKHAQSAEDSEQKTSAQKASGNDTPKPDSSRDNESASGSGPEKAGVPDTGDKDTRAETGGGASPRADSEGSESPPRDVHVEANFSMFISSLSMQALILLGEMDNPLTHTRETNLEQSKYIIDTIAMLKEKTKGNLNADEANLIDNVLYELKMKYTAKSGKISS